MTASATQEEAERAYHRLACLYARAMDANEPDLLDRVMTAEGVIDSLGHLIEGREAVRACPAMLRDMYLMTQHQVHNQTLALTSDNEAEGETYCTASHIQPPAGEGHSHTAYVWAIRYQDSLRRGEDGQWRIARRKLLLDWTETRPIGWRGRR
ncbi:MAG: nuclear transport factor 2 family protein [Novosphingobium sp.]|nr:nuclear transport factor 2 family protein [Novosphingobium sp.]